MRSHSAKFKRIEFVGAYLTCLRIAIVGFFLVGAKIRLLHEVGQALLRISFQALNLAAFYIKSGLVTPVMMAFNRQGRSIAIYVFMASDRMLCGRSNTIEPI